MSKFSKAIKHWGMKYYLLYYPNECLCPIPQLLQYRTIYRFYPPEVPATGRCEDCGLKIKARKLKVNEA